MSSARVLRCLGEIPGLTRCWATEYFAVDYIELFLYRHIRLEFCLEVVGLFMMINVFVREGGEG